ncbi:AurF N-oxygenase family protein [Lapillicoccus jejuensis]|uniref:Para-aminobenzoate N-oxygenase AurF n=1 Tax=Lapillicoccus jejuensis TaxID=402171 RepID=A0A542DY29_9MICO|nr:diiron oxygenase [Lapillicoccus jejuensis]TQJ08001.1 para-aminobenzoate N-oxygenase AurF [Lapillicoccus jejuensis]
MTTTASPARSRIDETVAHRLLESSRTLSFDPTTEVDWDAPLDPTQHGLSPEWSSLYGTPLWDRMTPEQRVTLTRHEACSVMSTGIWFEMILQQMVLRELYASDPTRSEFMFGLTEIADECRHSIMFARAMQTMGVPAYGPSRLAVELARGYKTLATGESAYGGILVAEEVLDIYQRDLMRDERVLPVIRTTSRIHVVEESRHMTFAREEMKAALEGASAARRLRSGTLIAIVASVIVGNLVHPKVYAAAGLDVREAVAAAKDNPHHAAMLRTSSAHLMEFLDECGLVGGPARRIYSRLHLL